MSQRTYAEISSAFDEDFNIDKRVINRHGSNFKSICTKKLKTDDYPDFSKFIAQNLFSYLDKHVKVVEYADLSHPQTTIINDDVSLFVNSPSINFQEAILYHKSHSNFDKKKGKKKEKKESKHMRLKEAAVTAEWVLSQKHVYTS